MLAILELLPIALAIVAIFSASLMFKNTRRKHDRIRCIVGIVAAIVMIVAQTSWFTTYVLMGNLEDTSFANALWTIFNTLSMILVILQTIPRVGKRKDTK